MKKILLTFSVLIFFSCKTDEEKAKEKRIKESITADVMNDFNDGFQESLIERNFNNDEIRKAPVKVVSCEFVQDSMSTSKHI